VHIETVEFLCHQRAPERLLAVSHRLIEARPCDMQHKQHATARDGANARWSTAWHTVSHASGVIGALELSLPVRACACASEHARLLVDCLSAGIYVLVHDSVWLRAPLCACVRMLTCVRAQLCNRRVCACVNVIA
jgi:hypothetical protein